MMCRRCDNPEPCPGIGEVPYLIIPCPNCGARKPAIGYRPFDDFEPEEPYWL